MAVGEITTVVTRIAAHNLSVRGVSQEKRAALASRTLAFGLDRQPVGLRRPCFLLDGDELRGGLNADLGVELIVIAAFMSPNWAERKMVR